MMKFCILIELSKERISFLYNRSDGVSGFVPFVEQGALPLAIYCRGNQITIGQFAVDEANNQSPNAFLDVFAKLRDGGTFLYRGEAIPSNMLLFTAIQRYLSDFFDKTLIGQVGRLEQNIATMPICFLFNADINENERLFVKDSFIKSGYANVGIRDCDQLAMRTVNAKTNNYVSVTSNGKDLFVNIYKSKGKRIDSFVIHDRGCDPRMNAAVDRLWDSIGYDNYYLNREQEQHILQQVAEDFLGSGKIELNESITFSSGHSYNVSLSLHELDQISVNDDGRVIKEVTSKLVGNGIKTSDCTVILQGKAAHNSFFSDMFRREFNIVKGIDNTMRTEMLANFLKDVKSSDYTFVDSSIEKEHLKTPSEPISVVPVSQIESVLPNRRDERDFKILCIDVDTHLRNGRITEAKIAVDRFSELMHEKKVTAFDEELNSLLTSITEHSHKSKSPMSEPEKPQVELPSTDKRVPPTKRDERDMKMLRMEVATYRNNGETKKIKVSVEEFRKKMHEKNVYAFDDELDSFLKQKIEKSKKSTPLPEVLKRPTPKPKSTLDVDEGTRLMREEKFKEARDWFRSNGRSNNVDDCTSVIKALRFLPIYESELSATASSGNKDKAKARVKDIQEIIMIYRKYNIDASKLTKLSDAYKRIK